MTLDQKVVLSMKDPNVWKVVENNSYGTKYCELESCAQPRVIYCPPRTGARELLIPSLFVTKRLGWWDALRAYFIFHARVKAFVLKANQEDRLRADAVLQNLGAPNGHTER